MIIIGKKQEIKMTPEELFRQHMIKHFEKKEKLIEEYTIEHGHPNTWTCDTKCRFAYDWGCLQR